MHSTIWVWISKAALEAAGGKVPETRDELVAVTDAMKANGIIPLAHGGQAWQEACMFEAVAAGVGGAAFYRRALVDLDDATLRGPEMVAEFTELAALRGMIDANAPGRDWNLASAMVINGEAAMQIMGDGAKGEFANAGKTAGDDHACIPVPKAKGDAFVYLVNALSLFTQSDPDLIMGQEVLASAIMDKGVQVAFNVAKGTIPARNDGDMGGLDACAQATSAAMTANAAGGTAVPTFAGTHAANASVVGGATDATTGFFNSDMTPAAGATALADAIMAAK